MGCSPDGYYYYPPTKEERAAEKAAERAREAAARKEKARQEALNQEKEALRVQGAKALREVFGEKAEAVAFLIADIANKAEGNVKPDDVAKIFKDVRVREFKKVKLVR